MYWILWLGEKNVERYENTNLEEEMCSEGGSKGN